MGKLSHWDEISTDNKTVCKSGPCTPEFIENSNVGSLFSLINDIILPQTNWEINKIS